VSALVTEEDIAAYRRDGAVRIRGVASAAEIALVSAAIDRVLAEPSELALVASREDDGLFFEDFRNWQRIEEIERFVRSSPAAEVVAALTGSSQVRLYHDHVLVKEAFTSQRTPWHQDQPYYNVAGTRNASMWLPIDSVDRESTLEFVAGSHLGPWLMPRTFMDGEAKWFPEGSLVELPDIEAERNDHRIVAWELEPGDAVFFNMLTLHAAGGVSRNSRRRVLSIRYLGDDMVHAPRPWRTSPPFPGLEDDLPDGAPLDHPLFPILWSAPRLAGPT
jgi:ectoine hydroxylase-related dioxygenase (phytanoyl-CoA dioxygenase family)